MLLAIALAAIWFGGSSTSENVRTAVLGVLRPVGAPDVKVSQPGAHETSSYERLPSDDLGGQGIPSSVGDSDPYDGPRAVEQREDDRPKNGESPFQSTEDGQAPDASANVTMPETVDQSLLQSSQQGPTTPGAIRQDVSIGDEEAASPSIPLESPAADAALSGFSSGPIPSEESAQVSERPEPTLAGSGDDGLDPLTKLERSFGQLPIDVKRKDDRLLIADLGRSIQFADGSSVLDNSARAALRQIAETLNDVEDVLVNIVGHTDTSGTEGVNQWLSERRAEAVARYLVGQGVSADRLDHEGRGQTELKLDVEQERIRGPWINRRIELEISSGRVASGQ
jgi:outer membrane protein OmpA-like peptidoglycan-associated protein